MCKCGSLPQHDSKITLSSVLEIERVALSVVLASLNVHGYGSPDSRTLRNSLPIGSFRGITTARDTRFHSQVPALYLKLYSTCYCKKAVCSSQADNCRSGHSKPHAVVRPLGLVIVGRSPFDLRAPHRAIASPMTGGKIVRVRHPGVRDAAVDIAKTLPTHSFYGLTTASVLAFCMLMLP